MEQLSLFDTSEKADSQIEYIRLTAQQEEELKREMAFVIIDYYRKESEDNEKHTGA
jgi:hypothetical protein